MLLSFLIVFALVTCTFSIDCFVTRNAPILYKDALTCLSNIPINEDYRQTALDNFQKTADTIYVFQKLTSPTDSRVDVSVDIPQRLEQIRSTTYSNEFDFINDFLAVARDLRDCHIGLTPPTPYSAIVATLPFLFGALKDASSKLTLQIIGVMYSAVAVYDKHNIKFDVDLRTLTGFTVDTINDIPAIDFLTEFARNQVGFSDEFSQRFETSLDQPSLESQYFSRGCFSLRNYFSGFPKESTMKFSVSNESSKYDIVVPFLLELSPSSSASIVHLTSCHNNARNNEEQEESSPFYQRSIVHTGAQKRATNEIDDIETVKVEKGVYFYKYENTGIVMIPTWSSDDEILDEFYDGFNRLCEKGVTDLLFDVQNNLGGNMCLSQSVISFLFEEPFFEKSDFEQTPNSQLLMKAMLEENILSFWSPSFYLDPVSHQTLTMNSEWIKTQVPKDILNYPATRSIATDCKQYTERIPKTKCKFEKISILSNGICASACDVFSSYLQQKYNARVIGIGGLENERYSVGTCGAKPISDNEIRLTAEYGKIKEKHPNEFINFPTMTPCSTQFSFPFREIENYKSQETGDDFPLQYHYDPVTVRMPRTAQSLTSRRQQWIDAINLPFDTNKDSDSDSNSNKDSNKDSKNSSTNSIVIIGIVGAVAFAVVVGIIFIVVFRARIRNQFSPLTNMDVQ